MTRAPKVKRAIVTAVSQHATFRNRQVSISHPGADLETEAVFIAGVRNTEVARSLGKAHRRETLTVDIAVVCEVLGVDLDETESRAWTMVAGVEEAIAEDSSLGGIALMCEVTGFDQRSFNGPERSVIECTVECTVVCDKDYES
jgi:hypothetical protein